MVFFLLSLIATLQNSAACTGFWQVTSIQGERLKNKKKTLTFDLLQSGTSMKSYHKYLLCIDGDYAAALVQNTNAS